MVSARHQPSRVSLGNGIPTHDLDRPFLLTVTNIKPHKNLKRLLEAFAPESAPLSPAPSETLAAELDVARVREILDVNLMGAFLGLRAVIPVMRAQARGSVVNVGSLDGLLEVFGVDGTRWFLATAMKPGDDPDGDGVVYRGGERVLRGQPVVRGEDDHPVACELDAHRGSVRPVAAKAVEHERHWPRTVCLWSEH